MKTDPISAAVTYRHALEDIARAPSLAAAVRIAQRMLEFTFNRPEEGQIGIDSGYGHNTKTPFVTFSLANPSESANPTIQMSSAQARVQAHYILEAADAADTDAFICTFFGEQMGLPIEQIGGILSQFRAWRDLQRGTSTDDS